MNKKLLKPNPPKPFSLSERERSRSLVYKIHRESFHRIKKLLSTIKKNK